jgi:hypothetical protein
MPFLVLDLLFFNLLHCVNCFFINVTNVLITVMGLTNSVFLQGFLTCVNCFQKIHYYRKMKETLKGRVHLRYDLRFNL